MLQIEMCVLVSSDKLKISDMRQKYCFQLKFVWVSTHILFYAWTYSIFSQ